MWLVCFSEFWRRGNDKINQDSRFKEDRNNMICRTGALRFGCQGWPVGAYFSIQFLTLSLKQIPSCNAERGEKDYL